MIEILRKGAVVRVTPERDYASAQSFVDLRFEDGHVERWRGSYSGRELIARDDLFVLAEDLIDDEEGQLFGEIHRDYKDASRDQMRAAPVEIVVEWNQTRA